MAVVLVIRNFKEKQPRASKGQKWVRLYREEHSPFSTLPCTTRGIAALLLKVCDEEGRIDCGDMEPSKVVARQIRAEGPDKRDLVKHLKRLLVVGYLTPEGDLSGTKLQVYLGEQIDPGKSVQARLRRDEGTTEARRRRDQGATKARPRRDEGAADGAEIIEADFSHRRSDKRREDKRRVATPAYAVGLAEYLLEAILSHLPGFKKPRSLDGWARDLDLAVREDGRGESDLRAVIDYAHRSRDGAFWRANVQSGRKVRLKFDQLTAEMQRVKPERRGSITPSKKFEGGF